MAGFEVIIYGRIWVIAKAFVDDAIQPFTVAAVVQVV